MEVSLIVAMDEAGGIGLAGTLPWRLSADLRHFKQRTLGHHLIMGRKTFESIGRSLPGRTTLILSRKHDYTHPACQAPTCRVLPSLDRALAFAREAGEDEAFIVGGSEIFSQALPLATRLYLTRVHTQTQADVFFPEFELSGWRLQETFFQPADEKNEFPFTFSLYVREPSPHIQPG